MNRLVVKLQSGEVRSLGFTVKTRTTLLQEDGTYFKPMDLTEYVVDFRIKLYPYDSVDAIVAKEITTEEDTTLGWIYAPAQGKFRVDFTQDDMDVLVPGKEYYLIIRLINGETKIIISGEGNNVGTLMVCNS